MTLVPEINLIEEDGLEVARGNKAAFTEVLEINEDQKDIRFEITLPGTFETDNVRFAYKLENYDKEWRESDRNSVTYTHLGGGTYTFKYRASLDGETWVDGRSELVLQKEYYLWRHPAILGLLIVLGAAFLLTIYWLRVRSIKRTALLRTEYEKRIAGVEMAALRAQMNPHFMFNSLNAIKTYILKERSKEASLYLTKFSQLMRAVLRNSKEQLITLEEELHALNLYIELEMLRFSDGFEYRIDIEEGIDSENTLVPPLLIQPYVENAIRHGLLPKPGEPKVLGIAVKPVNGSQIIISITDNGVGREASAAKKETERPERPVPGHVDHERSY